MPVPVVQPPILPGESILGYLQRLAIIGHNGAMKPLVRSVLPIKSAPAPWIFPSHLAHLASKIEALPKPEVLLAKHTIFPLVSAFSKSELRLRIASHMVQGSGSPMGLFFASGLAHSMSVNNRLYQTYCQQCCIEDSDRHGVAFWHAMHQIPWLATCGLHGSVLMTGSEYCGVTSRTSTKARLPMLMCSCAAPTRTLSRITLPSLLRRDAKMSSLIQKMLEHDWPAFEPEGLGRVYRMRAIEMGYSKGEAHMASTRFAAHFIQHYGREFLECYGSNQDPEVGGWITEAVRGKPPLSPVRNALLIDYMFSGLPDFVAALRATPLATDGLPRSGKVLKGSWSDEGPFVLDSRHRAAHRRIARGWLAQAEQPTRSLATSAIPSTASWLRRYDEKWFDRLLPRISLEERWAKKHHDLESRAVEAVYAAYRELTDPGNENQRPRRISRALLTRALSLPLRYLPAISMLAERLAEPSKAYKERLALWIYARPLLAPDGLTALDYAYQQTRVPKSRILQLAQVQWRSTGQSHKRT